MLSFILITILISYPKNLETGKLNWNIKLEFEKDENFSLVSGFFFR